MSSEKILPTAVQMSNTSGRKFFATFFREMFNCDPSQIIKVNKKTLNIIKYKFNLIFQNNDQTELFWTDLLNRI